MGQRLDLEQLLREVLGEENVYFQPPKNLQMVYPAIVYKVDTRKTQFAGNRPYSVAKRWAVTLISRDPEHPALETLEQLPTASFNRHFVADGLNHDVFTIFF